MAKQATGIKSKTTASSPSPSGSRSGMAVGPAKPTAKLSDISKPVIAKGPMAGVSTNPKKQPMYTGRPSNPSKMVKQYGTGLADRDNKGFNDGASSRTKPVRQKLNQG